MKIAELKQVSARPDVVEVRMHLYFAVSSKYGFLKFFPMFSLSLLLVAA